MFCALVYQNLHRFTGTNYFWRRRIIFISTMLLLLFLEVAELKPNEFLGLSFLEKTSYLLFALFTILSPLSCANAFVEEKNKNTLGILLMTKLSPVDIVMSKLVSRFFVMVFYLLGTLPIFMICFSFGGISAEQIIHIFIALVVFIFFSGSVGLFFSVAGFTKVYFGTIVNVVIFCFFLVLQSLLSLNLSSWSSAMLFLKGETGISAYQGIFVEVLNSFLCIFATVKIFNQPSSSISHSQKNKSKVEWSTKFINIVWHQNNAPLKERNTKKLTFTNPIEWKDYYFLHYPKISSQKTSCFLCLLLFCFIFIPILNVLFFLILATILLVAGLKTFAQEPKAFEVILITPMNNRQIIKGKLYAIYKAMNWFARIFMTVVMIATVAFISILPLMALAISYTISILVFITICAMFCSFSNPKPLAAFTSSTIIIVVSQSLFYTLFSINPFIGALLVPALNFTMTYYLYQYMVKHLRNEKFIYRYYVT